MTTKKEVLDQIATAVSGVSGIVGTYTYPWQFSSTPVNVQPVAIVQEYLANANTSAMLASGCVFHNWVAEVLVIVGRGESGASYPSVKSAAYEELTANLEADVVTAVLGANIEGISDTIEAVQSVSAWFHWVRDDKKKQPVFAIRVLVPITMEI